MCKQWSISKRRTIRGNTGFEIKGALALNVWSWDSSDIEEQQAAAVRVILAQSLHAA
jgi:hypothetical protein